MSDTVATSDELLARFDAGEDVLDLFDLQTAEHPNRSLRRVNVDFPAWMVDALDKEAGRLGINRQAVIKTWIADRIDRMRGAAATP
jgi:hypothetical protein